MTSILGFGCRIVIFRSTLSAKLTRSLHFTAAEKLETYKQTSLRRSKVSNTTMDPTILWPPESVRGMKSLDVSAFKKTVSVPVAKVSLKNIGIAIKILKKYFLKMRDFSSHKENPEDPGSKIVYLNPLLYSEKEQEIKSEIKACEISSIEFSTESLELSYDNWDANMTLRSILPLEEAGVSGYSVIGHIIHLNLKDYLEPYKKIIGTVLLDKSRDDVTMVVNKVDTIDNSDNTFRSFSMEILAGEGSTVTTLKQNRCSFMFDFAKVYWNPRLSTEHEMIIKKLNACDILYDVMAGVGPFSVPAAMQKKCQVLANDLNPESHKWLVHNTSLNKVKDRVSCYNMDGNEFISDIIKKDLLARWKDSDFDGEIHLTMNLPSIAVEFLQPFVGLLSDVDLSGAKITEPIVHVYMFSKDQKVSSCVTRVAYYLGLVDILPDFDADVTAALEAKHQKTSESTENGSADVDNAQQEFGKRSSHKLIQDEYNIPGLDVVEVTFVRRVAPVKVMVRVSVRLTKKILVDTAKLGASDGLQSKIKFQDVESESSGSSPKRPKLH